MEEGLEDFLVVWELADVFPAEFPGFSAERELDFTVEFNPGTKPIARMPYLMLTYELQELTMQLNSCWTWDFYIQMCHSGEFLLFPYGRRRGHGESVFSTFY
jgi:hypothetical protein